MAETKEQIRDKAVKSVLRTLDGKGGSCYCGGHNGKDHDLNPPCDTVKKAQEIVKSISYLLREPTAV